MQVQFLLQVSAMRLHRVQAEIEKLGNLLVRLELRQQLKNLPFAWRQQVVAILSAASPDFSNVVLHQNPRDFRTEESLALVYGFDRGDQIPLGGVLQKIPFRSRLQRS